MIDRGEADRQVIDRGETDRGVINRGEIDRGVTDRGRNTGKRLELLQSDSDFYDKYEQNNSEVLPPFCPESLLSLMSNTESI